MKIALAFDDLVQNGGAERLLLAAAEIWPEASVYTSLAIPEWQHLCREKGISLRTSYMQKLPFKEKLNRLYSIFGLHMLAFESFDFSQYDLVLSISSRYAHGVITKPFTKHICYMNTPGRMFWDAQRYFGHENIYVRFFHFLIQPFLSHARNWDYTVARRVDHFIANSPVSQARIKKYYGKDSPIVFPPVDFPENADKFTDPKLQEEKYFLIITRLSSWKRVDIAIEACAKLKRNLKIVGEGPALKKLQRQAKRLGAESVIEFLGYVPDKEKWKLIRNSQALLMTQNEDFGIAPLEAMSMGRPVLAYKKGGAIFTIVPGKTGDFFEEQTAESLANKIRDFAPDKYVSQDCQKQAQKFSKQKFQTFLQDEINRVYYSEI